MADQDMCTSIVGQANSIWNSIANLNSQYTSSSQGNQFGLIIVGLIILYTILTIMTPRQQTVTQKGRRQQ